MVGRLAIEKPHDDCTESDIKYLEGELLPDNKNQCRELIVRWNSISAQYAQRLANLLRLSIETVNINFFCDDAKAIEAVYQALDQNKAIQTLHGEIMGADKHYQFDRVPVVVADSVQNQEIQIEDGASNQELARSENWSEYLADTLGTVSEASGQLWNGIGGNALLNQFSRLSMAACSSLMPYCLPHAHEEDNPNPSNKPKVD